MYDHIDRRDFLRGASALAAVSCLPLGAVRARELIDACEAAAC